MPNQHLEIAIAEEERADPWRETTSMRQIQLGFISISMQSA
jgi:hypothetical protein